MSYLLELPSLLKALEGLCLQQEKTFFSGITIDSRKVVKNRVFFALKGERFDGHDFLSQALDQGAGAFVVSDKEKIQHFLKSKKITIIYVPDTLQAFQSLARFWRKQMKIKVAAVTGSNGKTTTCSFAQTLFSGVSSFASPKSYNNSVGVPLSILNVDCKKSFLIQEIGTNKPGEVAFLTTLCDPVVSAVTMVGPSHLEGLSSLESVAQEKQDIYLKSPKAFWIFNKDNIWTEKMFQKWGLFHRSVLTFSSVEKKTDITLRFLREEVDSSVIAGRIGSVTSKTKVLFSGIPNLENMMCACGLALGAGLDAHEIWNRLSQCKLPGGRQEWFQMKKEKISILFDAYNANPSSMEFFFQSCKNFSKAGQRLYVIGDMRELGKESEKYHIWLASHPALLQSRLIVFIGEHGDVLSKELKKNNFKGQFIHSLSYNNQILSTLRSELKAGDFLAIKASRNLRLERLFFDLTGKKILI